MTTMLTVSLLIIEQGSLELRLTARRLDKVVPVKR